MNTILISVGAVLFALFLVGLVARLFAALERRRAPRALQAALAALKEARLDDVSRLLPFAFHLPVNGRYAPADAATALGALDLFEGWAAAHRSEGAGIITQDLREALERAGQHDAAVPGRLGRRFKRLLWALAAKGADRPALLTAAREQAAQEEGEHWEDEDGEVRMAQLVLPAAEPVRARF